MAMIDIVLKYNGGNALWEAEIRNSA